MTNILLNIKCVYVDNVHKKNSTAIKIFQHIVHIFLFDLLSDIIYSNSEAFYFEELSAIFLAIKLLVIHSKIDIHLQWSWQYFTSTSLSLRPFSGPLDSLFCITCIWLMVTKRTQIRAWKISFQPNNEYIHREYVKLLLYGTSIRF